eukprot:s155_g6.t1
MAVFTSLLLERYFEKFTEEQEELVVQWEAELLGVQHFFKQHAYKLIQLGKQTMREVVDANVGRTDEWWNRAKKFYVRHWHLLTVDQKEYLDDWEFVLCDMRRLDAMAFLSRMDRCFDRSHLFLQQNAEAIKQLGAGSLQGVLHSRQLRDDPMSAFTLCFFERYFEHFTDGQKNTLSMWEVEFCRTSPEVQERARRTCGQTFLRAQEFMVKFADDIVQLQKKNLREVVMSNQAKKHAEWMQAKNFFIRHFHFLTVEQRELLEDWEFVLCDVSALETVVFLPRLQRCLQRVDVLLTERVDALKKIGAKTVQSGLRSRHMLRFPMSTFSRVLLERYRDKLSAEQCVAMSVWEAKLCQGSAEDIAQAARNRSDALVRVQGFLAQFAAEIVQLQKQTLRDVAMSNQAHDHAAWMQAQNFYARHVFVADG